MLARTKIVRSLQARVLTFKPTYRSQVTSLCGALSFTQFENIMRDNFVMVKCRNEAAWTPLAPAVLRRRLPQELFAHLPNASQAVAQ
jgi:hypothetical protein